MKRRVPAACLLMTGLCVSCLTVKENRTDCPCYLVFKAGDSPVNFDRDGMFTFSAYDVDGHSVDVPMDVVSWRYLLEPAYEVPIRKGLYRISTFTGLLRGEREGNALFPASGMQVDSLYAGSSAVDCRGEEAEVLIGDCKQFTTVSLKVNYVAEDAMMPYYVKVRGNCSGLDMRTLESVRREYSFVPVEDGAVEGQYVFRLPRQPSSAPAEIVVELWSRRFECRVDAFDIDRHIRLAGFDWSAASLDDVGIEIDFGRAEISVIQNGWETVLPMDIEI